MKAQNSINVAVVEDITLVRMGICSILAQNDRYKVTIEASNGREFIEMMEASDQKVHICLLDIQMPQMDGHETIRVIRKRWPDIKVLALSMFNDDYNVIKMLRNGASGYILKNCSADELNRALGEVTKKGFYHSDLVNEHFFHMMQQKDNGNGILTDKDLQFLSFCCSELTYKEIAEVMKLSPRTVEGYRDALCEKLNIKSRTGLVMYAMKIGVTPYAP